LSRETVQEWASQYGLKVAIIGALSYYLLRTVRRPLVFSTLKDEPARYVPINPLTPQNFSGRSLRILSYLTNTRIGDWFINPMVLKVLGITRFRTLNLNEYQATFYPVTVNERLAITKPQRNGEYQKGRVALDCALATDIESNGFKMKTCKYFTDGYKSGSFTPRDIAEQILKIIESKNDELKAICDFNRELVLSQADQSSQRWKSGNQLSELDGVPAVVKDHIDVKGLTARNGLSFQNDIKKNDSLIVQRMKSAGIMIIGVSHMTQMGMAVFGNNPSEHHGTCRNPVNPNHYPGASSSGTAAAITSGMVPFGIGTDGGGSIRMPSSQCGIVGLKPTFARCPTHGNLKGGCRGTVSHCGPMAGNAVDLSLLYSIIAGPTSDDPYSMLQPAVSIPQFTNEKLNFKIGVDWQWAEQADPDVFTNFKDSILKLESLGCEIKEIQVRNIPETNTGHLIAISGEGAESAREFIHTGRNLSPENFTILNAALSSLTAADYLLSAKLRTKVMADLEQLFSEVDILATPSCGNTAEPILASDEMNGTWKLRSTLMQMLYVKLANFTGIPAISVPSGYDNNGLPTGIMLHGKWYDEEKLIKTSFHLEKLFERQKPQVFYNY